MVLFTPESLNRTNIYQFGRWTASLLNRIDQECPDILYIFPESFVEITFEVFKAFKRSEQPIYETEEEKAKYPGEWNSLPCPEQPKLVSLLV